VRRMRRYISCSRESAFPQGRALRSSGSDDLCHSMELPQHPGLASALSLSSEIFYMYLLDDCVRLKSSGTAQLLFQRLHVPECIPLYQKTPQTNNA